MDQSSWGLSQILVMSPQRFSETASQVLRDCYYQSLLEVPKARRIKGGRLW